jgi:hypothetical protein
MVKVPEWFSTWFDSPYYHILYEQRDEDEAAAADAGVMAIGNAESEGRGDGGVDGIATVCVGG